MSIAASCGRSGEKDVSSAKRTEAAATIPKPASKTDKPPKSDADTICPRNAALYASCDSPPLIADPNARYRVPLDGAHRLGPPDAPVRIVLYTDVVSEEARRIREQLSILLDRLQDRVALYVKLLPGTPRGLAEIPADSPDFWKKLDAYSRMPVGGPPMKEMLPGLVKNAREMKALGASGHTLVLINGIVAAPALMSDVLGRELDTMQALMKEGLTAHKAYARLMEKAHTRVTYIPEVQARKRLARELELKCRSDRSWRMRMEMVDSCSRRHDGCKALISCVRREFLRHRLSRSPRVGDVPDTTLVIRGSTLPSELTLLFSLDGERWWPAVKAAVEAQRQYGFTLRLVPVARKDSELRAVALALTGGTMAPDRKLEILHSMAPVGLGPSPLMLRRLKQEAPVSDPGRWNKILDQGMDLLYRGGSSSPAVIVGGRMMEAPEKASFYGEIARISGRARPEEMKSHHSEEKK